MIEGCIVAKLVLGYLTDEGLHRTRSSFQEECSLFHNGNSNLDQVLLTSDLKTILEDYSQLKETGRESGIPTSTAILKSLWRDLDVVVGQLKYATIPTNAPKVNTMGSQSTRTRRLNNDRSRRSTIQKNHERVTTSPSTIQRPSTPTLPESNAADKLPLPRLSTVGPAQNQLSSSNNSQTTNPQSSCTSGRAQSTANKENNICQTLSNTQSTGVPVAGKVGCVTGSSPAGDPVAENVGRVTGYPLAGSPVADNVGHITGTPSSCVAGTASSARNTHTSIELSSNDDAMDGMFDVMDDGDFSGADHSSAETIPVIVINDESSKDQQVVSVEDHSSLSHSYPSQNELQLRSPKRKGVQPKKRVPQGAPGTSVVADSPVKLVPQSANQEVEMDITCPSDTLTPPSFLGTLLNTPLLQEKLAENINKVFGSSRAPPATDEPPSDSTQSMTTTEASSDDALMGSNQEAGSDIPVKEIMDLMQADPAFDVLFSFFGLDALDALPSASNSSTVLAGTSADSSQGDKSTSGSEDHIPGNEITTLPSGSSQQLNTQSSSSASNLHLSAASIVTDALLLLAGSPQKISPQTSSQLSYSANVPVSGIQNLNTPPKKDRTVQRNPANEKQQRTINQPALITSTLPYVRALNFAPGKEPGLGKGGRKKGSKNKKGTKQKTTINEQSKASLNKKGASGIGIGRRRAKAKKPPEITSVSSSSDTGFGGRTVQAVSCLTNTTGIGQSVITYGSTFNRRILPNPSPVNIMIPSSHPNPTPYSFVNCTPDPTFLPVNVISSSSSPVNMISSSAVTYVNPAFGLSPGPTPSPGSHTGAVAQQSPFPVNHTSLGTNAVASPVNFNNLSTSTTPSPVNFTTSGAVHVPSPLVLGSVPTPSPVSLDTLYPPQLPSAVNLVNTGTGHVPLPSAFMNLNPSAMYSATSAHQAVNTVMPSQAVNTVMPSQAVNTVMPSQAVNTVMPSHAFNTVMPSQAVNTVMTSQAVNTVMPSQAVNTVMPSQAVNTVMPSQAVNTVMPSQAVNTVMQSQAVNTVMPSQAVNTVMPSQAVNTVMPSHAFNTVMPSQAVNTVMPSQAVNTVMTSQAVNTVMPSQAVNTVMPSQAVNTVMPSQAVNTVMPSQAVNTVMPSQAVNTVMPSQAVNTVMPSQAVNTVMPSQAVNTVMPSQAVNTVMPSQAVNTVMPSQAVNTVMPSQAVNTVMPSQAVNTVMPSQAVNTVMPSQAVNTVMPSQAVNTVMPSQAVNTVMPSQAVNTVMPSQAVNTVMPSQAVNTVMTSQAVNTVMQSQAVNTVMPSQAVNTVMTSQAVNTVMQSQAVNTVMPSQAVNTVMQSQAVNTVMPSQAVNTVMPSQAVNTVMPSQAVNTVMPSQAVNTVMPSQAVNTVMPSQAVNTVMPSQAVNTVMQSQAVTPGSLTESTVISATAGITNSITCEENHNAGVSSGSAPSASSETVSAGINDLSTSLEPFSLEASNMLQTIAQKHANAAQMNSTGPQHLASGSNSRRLSAHSLQKNVIHLTVDADAEHQPLKEKSSAQGNVNVSKDSAEVSSEKHVQSMSLVRNSSSPNPVEQEFRGTVPVVQNLQNSLENKNGATSSLVILNQECSELMKENSTGFLHSKQSGESERQVSSNSRTKRKRDELRKEKKTKSSSRPSKRSKTKGESMNFPSNLNVEEFLSKLHYEDK